MSLLNSNFPLLLTHWAQTSFFVKIPSLMWHQFNILILFTIDNYNILPLRDYFVKIYLHQFTPNYHDILCRRLWKYFLNVSSMGEKGEVLESVKRSSAAVILSVAAVEESREAACLWLVSSPLAIIRRLLLSSVFKRRRTKKKTPTDTHRQTFFSSKPSSSSPFARQTTKFSCLASFLTLLYIRHVLRH